MNKTMKSVKSVISVLCAGILWGLIGLFVRNLAEYELSSMCIVFIRSLAGTILMGVFLLFYNRTLFRIKLKDLWCFVGTGIISLCFFNICYFQTMKQTSLSVAAILLYTAPAMVMILSRVVFKEALSGRKIAAVILAFAGCVLVTGVCNHGTGIPGFAILTGLGAGLGYALYSIFARFAIERGYNSFTITFYTLACSVFGSVFFFKPVRVGLIVAKEPWMLLVFMLFGLVSTVMPYILYTLGLQGMEAGKASVIASIEPVTATVIGILVFHEPMTLMGVFGSLLVLLSIVIVNYAPKKS